MYKKVPLSKIFGHSMEREHNQPERMTRQRNHTLASQKLLKISGNQHSTIGRGMRPMPWVEQYPSELWTSSLAVTRTRKMILNESCCVCFNWSKLILPVERRSCRQQLLNASLKYSDTSNLVSLQVPQTQSGNSRKQWASLVTSKLSRICVIRYLNLGFPPFGLYN